MKLGGTAAFCFTSNNPLPEEQAQTLIKAKQSILSLVNRKHAPFLVSIQKSGSLRELEEMPEPRFHGYIRPEDWESYKRAKLAESQEKRLRSFGVTKILR